jgi:hypothetical protein
MPGNRYCTIQVDADGLWALGKLIGQDTPLEPDPVFELGIGRLLKLFDEFSVKATFFVVGRDLDSNSKVNMLRRVLETGHEIASHGMGHRYLSGMAQDERRDEMVSGKKRIEDVLGVKVTGFKAAGFTADRNMVKDLEDAGYLYDSSVLGTSLAVLMEAVSGLSYPKSGMLRSPQYPYRPSREDIFRRGDSAIIELPVTTMPFLRFPMHFSYATLGGKAYSGFSRFAIAASGARFVNYLFHPLDMLDAEDVRLSKKVYGLAIKASVKAEMARKMLSFFKKRYEVVTSQAMCGIAGEHTSR